MARGFDTPIITNDQSIDRVLAAGLPVLLVFLSDRPGGSIAATLEKIAAENASDLLVARLQIKENPLTTRRYEIKQTPAVVTIGRGQTLSKAEGVSSSDIEKHTAFLLGKGPKPQPSPQPSVEYTHGRPPAGQGHASAGGGRPMVVNDASFDTEVIRSSQPVLVDFWAPWCGPCKMTEPVVEKLAREMSGRLKVVKINVDENPIISNQYAVRSIPTMMVVRNGQVVDRWSGALPEQAMRTRVSSALNRQPQ